MKIDVRDLMINSFVIVEDEQSYADFCVNFAKAGFTHIPTRFMSAVPGRYLERFSTTGSYGRSPGTTMSKAYNHTAAVRFARTLGFDYVGIFESDSYPRIDCSCKLNQFLSSGCIPDNVGILSLGSIRFVDNPSDDLRRTNLADCNNSCMRIVSDIWGSHATIVFRSAYDEYIENAELRRFSNPPDAYEHLVESRYCTTSSFFIQARKGVVSWLDYYSDRDKISSGFGIKVDK